MMILVLLVVYLVVLFLLVKLNIIKLNLFWKLSPLLWVVILLVFLFFPLQFWAPAGFAWVVQPTVQIVPNVAGRVVKVNVGPSQKVKEGDVLFEIDKRPFQATVDQLSAAMVLNKLQVAQQQQLANKGLGRKADLDQANANLAQTQAQLDSARFYLEQATVRSPSDGTVLNVEGLRTGTRVVAAPLRQAMTLIDNSKRIIVAQIHQIYLRNIEPGQNAELTFKIYPGQIINAKVEVISAGSALGQVNPSGTLPAAVVEQHAPMWVRLTIDDEEIANLLPAGATGSVAIYSPNGTATHVIRKVMIRMESIINYISPF